MKPLTIAYFTSRKDPKIEWFFCSLNRELKGDWSNVEVLVVDYWFQYEGEARTKMFKDKVNLPNVEDIFKQVKHLSPKRSFCQGVHRYTKNEHFAASNARNTAFLHATHPFVACVDDLSVLANGWLDQVMWAYDNNCVILGAYAKVNDLKCDTKGKYASKVFKPGIDSRYNSQNLGSNMGAQLVDGSWLFGCSFGIPLDFALRVDGFDELCDMQGAEDYDFGIRVGRLGVQIFYCRNMMTYESEELHHCEGNAKFVRESKICTANGLMPYKAGIMSDHAALQSVREEQRQLPIFRNALLQKREMRFYDYDTSWKSRYGVPCDWRTGEMLKDL